MWLFSLDRKSGAEDSASAARSLVKSLATNLDEQRQVMPKTVNTSEKLRDSDIPGMYAHAMLMFIREHLRTREIKKEETRESERLLGD